MSGDGIITCEYCHTLPHKSGCPAADDKDIKICDFCGREILEDEFYIEADGSCYHPECSVF